MLQRLLFAIVVICISLASTGCKTNLRFYSGQPYASSFRIEEGVIVSFPDLIVNQKARATVGPWYDRHAFNIPTYEAYSTETKARLDGLFTQGVTITVHTALADINDRVTPESAKIKEEEPEAIEAETITPKKEGDPDNVEPETDADAKNQSNLDRIMADLEKKQAGDKTIKKTEEELLREAYAQATLEMVDQKNASYLLRFRDAIMLIDPAEGRIKVSFAVELFDLRTNARLFSKRYQGRSQRFEPRNSNKTNENQLVFLTKQAFSGPMSQMIDDIAKETGNWRPRR